MIADESKINAMLIELDIEGYIASGAPSDEYASEAKVLAAALRELDQQELKITYVEEIASEIWATSFELSETDIKQRKQAFQSLAEKVMLEN